MQKDCKTQVKRTGGLLEALLKRKILEFSLKLLAVRPEASLGWAAHGKNAGIAEENRQLGSCRPKNLFFFGLPLQRRFRRGHGSMPPELPHVDTICTVHECLPVSGRGAHTAHEPTPELARRLASSVTVHT